MTQYVETLARPAPKAIAEEDDLLIRIAAEFHEMPGLTLTLAQAARLFNVDSARCERVLGSLVKGRVLHTDGRTFARCERDRWPRRCA